MVEMPVLNHAVNGEQHANEREHEADWPANIESHKISSFRLVYQKITFRITQQINSTMPTTAGRCQTGWFWSTIFGVSE